MGDKDISAIEKLDGSNYTSWRRRIELYIKQKKGHDHLIKDPPTVAAEKIIWEEKENELMYKLSCSISNKLINDTKKYTTVKGLMSHFEDLFNRRTPLTVAKLFTKVIVPMKTSDNPIDFINDYENNFHLLEEQQFRKMKNLDAMLLLALLPDKFNVLITAISSKSLKDLDITEIKSQIIEEYERQQSQGENNDVVAFKALDNKPHRKNAPITCHYCKKRGHMLKDCRKRMRNQAGNQNSTKPQNSSTSYTVEGANAALHTAVKDNNKVEWILDSGASDHYTSDLNSFVNFTQSSGHVIVANGKREAINGHGMVTITQGNKKLILENVKYVPTLACNLISVSRLQENNLNVNFSKTTTITSRKTGKCVISCQYSNGVYKVNNAFTVQALKCIHTWHRILGHRNYADIKKLNLNMEACSCSNFCEACTIGKFKRSPFPKHSDNKSDIPHEVITADVFGPSPVVSNGNSKYFVTMTDEATKYSEVNMMKNRSETPFIIKCFLEKIHNNFGKYPKIIRTDNAKELVSKDFENYLKIRGITHHLTVPYSSQQNGMAERKNLTLMDSARTLIADSKLSNKFWGEAVMAVNFIYNRIPCSNGKIPFYEFYNRHCDIEFHRFGSTVYYWNPTPKRDSKLSPRSIPGILVGYSENSKGYRVYNKATRKVIITRDIKFTDECDNKDESNPTPEKFSTEIFNSDDEEVEPAPSPNVAEPTIEAQIEIPVQEQAAVQEQAHIEPVTVPTPPRRSSRQSKKPDYWSYHVYEEPHTHQQAIQSDEKEKWMEAMDAEFNSLLKNETFELVNLPKGRKAIKTKWVYKRKTDANDNVTRYKARLVAKGFSQIPGIDFEETYAPVSRCTTFRALLSIASSRKMEVIHIDIASAFLNGTIKEEIYIQQPPLFADQTKKVYRLKKCIYGLKQSANVFNETFTSHLQAIGFTPTQVDQCLYKAMIKGENAETTVYLMLYVDDVIICCENRDVINEIINKIRNKFEVNNLGKISQFLGMKIEKDSCGNFLISQEKFIKKIVEAVKMTDAKVSTYPLDPGYYKLKHDNNLPNNHQYQQLIGMLLYLATHTRPDISASVAILSQKTNSPSTVDLNEVKRIIRYIKGTASYKLKLSDVKPNNNIVEAFSDANFGEDETDRKSNSGFIIKLCGGVISWRCKKQTAVAMSTAESELYALAETAKEVLWIRKLLKVLDINPLSVIIRADNQSAIKIAEEEKVSDRTKFIATRYFFMKDHIKAKDFEIQYVPTEHNISDLLTKPLSGQRIKNLINTFLF